MREDEQFMKSRRLFSKLLILLAGWPGSLFAQVAKSAPRIPLVLKWDIRPANSQIEKEFLVTEYRNYYVYVAFNKGGPFDVSALRKFTGGGGSQIVTKDSLPVVVINRSAEEMRRSLELIDKGVYEWRQDVGVVMPVHMVLEKLDDDRNATQATMLVDETFNTDRECFGLDRAITEVALKPGTYRIKLRTLQETHLPSGAVSSLVIAYRPQTRVLKDKK